MKRRFVLGKREKCQIIYFRLRGKISTNMGRTKGFDPKVKGESGR